MIALKDNSPYFTPEEYFAWEEQQPEKYEYIDGEVYAMSGGSVNHGRIAIRFTALFDNHLANTTCITGNSDIKLNIVEANSYTYPDASVTCDDRDKTTTQYITYPCLIVEYYPAVRNPTTEVANLDYIEKIQVYKTIYL